MNALTEVQAIVAPDDGIPAGELLMDVKNVSLRFGGVKAITDISFNVRKGEIRAIIGPNGAGKTSMLNVINGFYTPQEGTITFRGVQRRAMKPHHAVRQGIARTFQNVALFKGMSTLDNIMAGRSVHMHKNLFWQMLWHGPALKTKRSNTGKRSRRSSISSKSSTSAARRWANCPTACRSASSLAVRSPWNRRCCLLDEPMAGMNLEEKEDMSRFILDVNRQRGTTICLIEHDMGVVMDLSDRVVVLDYGKKIADDVPDKVKSDKAVIDAYLGVAH
jgi:branched-chain amino acid transport system ATP-binding protein